MRVARAVVVAVLLGAGGLAGCGGGDDDVDPAAEAGTSTTARPRTMSVCGVEEAVDRINPAGGSTDFAEQRTNAIAYIDEILEVRALGRPPTDIAADYASVTEAYEVVRAAFDGATTPEEYLAAVEQGALTAFGSREEVERFEAAYTAWVQEQCGFDPQLGIELFADS
ncbi:MAG TPA: hypothetical protein VJ804_09395 [Acidimicrobiales bacterium]|nr:hypothetical protein [Acidimicrobiales bacterium]